MKTLILLGALVPSLAAVASAQTITVDIADDLIDVDPTTATVADLPGPDGKTSFSEAMIASNNTPGHQTIGFAIPTSEWTYLSWYLPGRAVVHTIGGFYWRAYDEVTIDGTTQTAFTGDTNPAGWEVVLWGTTIYLNADGCQVFGLDSSSVSVTGNNGLVAGNTLAGIELFGGSGSRVEGNTGGTIKIDRSSANVVVGNTYQRVRVLGWVGGGQPALDNVIGGPNPEDRNVFTGYGTWDGEGFPGGTTVQLFDTIGTVVENNWIGTPDGFTQGSLASTVGVGFEGENHDVVVRDNLISGILGHGTGPHAAGLLFGWGVLFGGAQGSNITVTGNHIGTDANGEPTLGSVWGIDVGNALFSGNYTGVRIGGSAPGEGNVVAGHLFNGITVGQQIGAARISGNSVFENALLGIELMPPGYVYGVTPNDPLDLDGGANGLQNFPVLASAALEGATVRVTGALNSAPLGDYTIELFASPACDPTGFGEGQVFLGATAVSTDAAGAASFDVQLPSMVPAGWFVTATATAEPLGATSELCACVALSGQGVSSYCTAGTSASGCQAALSASGVPSATAASGFSLSAAGVEGDKDGLFFFGTSGRQANPWGNGTSYQCVAPPVARAGLLTGSGSNGACDGSFAQDLNALWSAQPAKSPGAGAVVQAQLWYRDPQSTSNQTTSLSGALEFTVAP